MEQARSYAEWLEYATQLEQAQKEQKREEGVRSNHDKLYDRKLLHQKAKHLKDVRNRGDIQEMMFTLRADLYRNMANMTKSQIYYDRYVVPRTIQEYITEVMVYLDQITSFQGAELGTEEKLSFLQETRHAFGRTALVLSGGGALGAFHLGIIKTLLDHSLIPRVLAGSSVGSIVSAIVATHTDAELKGMFEKLEMWELHLFSNNTTKEVLAHLITKGTMHDIQHLASKLRKMLGDLTFQEAFEKTGRVLNVVVTAADTNEPPRVLNYLTSPNAVIWSAVAASSAFPGLFQPTDILAKNSKGEFLRLADIGLPGNERRWRDGSLEEDLPFRSLSELFNVNYFIVSQTNPHIVPLLNLKRKLSPSIAAVVEQEWKHRCLQLQRMLPDWLPSKWLQLFSQQWEGDVTIVLPMADYNLNKAMTNPTPEDLFQATKKGEQCTWEKFSAIKCNCAIEVKLDECLQKLCSKIKCRRKGGGNSRIPSWLHLASMGIPLVPSCESLLEQAIGAGEQSPHNSNTPHKMSPLHGHADKQPWTDSSGSNEGGTGDGVLPSKHAGAKHSKPQSPSSSSGARRTSMESCLAAEVHPPEKVYLPDIDCVDGSVDVWKCFLPLASSSIALDKYRQNSQALDVIAL